MSEQIDNSKEYSSVTHYKCKYGICLRLTDSNHHEWKEQFMRLISRTDLLGTVTGEDEEPEKLKRVFKPLYIKVANPASEPTRQTRRSASKAPTTRATTSKATASRASGSRAPAQADSQSEDEEDDEISDTEAQSEHSTRISGLYTIDGHTIKGTVMQQDPRRGYLTSVPNEDHKNWQKREREALALLTCCISDSLQRIYSEPATAAQLWEELNKAYAPTQNFSMASSLHISFFKMEPISNEKQADWLGRLRTIQAQLVGTKYMIADNVLRDAYLLGLPALYKPTVDTIWPMIRNNPDMTTYQVQQIIQEVETREMAHPNRMKDSTAQANYAGGTPKGAPEGYRDSSRNRGRGKGGKWRGRGRGRGNHRNHSNQRNGAGNEDSCYYCNQYGHFELNCPIKEKAEQRRKDREAKRRGRAREAQMAETQKEITEEEQEELDQYFEITDRYGHMATEEGGRVTTLGNGWLVDSGATDTYTMEKTDLAGYRMLPQPLPISTASGAYIHALGRGMAQIQPNLRVPALWVPKIARKLLSTHTLWKAGYMTVIGDATHIIERKTNRLIASTEWKILPTAMLTSSTIDEEKS